MLAPRLASKDRIGRCHREQSDLTLLCRSHPLKLLRHSAPRKDTCAVLRDGLASSVLPHSKEMRRDTTKWFPTAVLVTICQSALPRLLAISFFSIIASNSQASVAQRQSSGFVNRRSSVRIRPLAPGFERKKGPRRGVGGCCLADFLIFF